MRTQPTLGFFDGILLGNGDIGVCVTVRPDALGLHIGKNDCWDIRVGEAHAPHIKPFREDCPIVVHHDKTSRAQEAHQFLMHCLMDSIESALRAG